MRNKLVAGNWKMFGETRQNKALLESLRAGLKTASHARYAVCVPFPYLAQTQELLRGSAIEWGAQNVSEHEKGAYTGEVAASMLNDFGCRYVIVGHSERRALYHEDDLTVANKFMAAQKAGLLPILCVGETLAEREAGITENVVARQLDVVISKAGLPALGNAILAYEPVWAIGTGKTASPDQAQAVHQYIRTRLTKDDAALSANLTILYGGSVKGANARELFAMPDIDGGLIGGASLQAEEFLTICRACC